MADTTLQNFKQKLIGNHNNSGVISPARFEVIVYGLDDSRDITLSCDTAYIPGINMMTKEARTYGPLYEVPYAKTFDNIELTFMIDRSFQQRLYFEEWYDEIIDFNTNNAGYYTDMVRNIGLKNYDNEDRLVYECYMLNAFPKRIDMIPLSWASSDEFIKVSVNLAFENIIILDAGLETKIKDFRHFNKSTAYRGYTFYEGE